MDIKTLYRLYNYTSNSIALTETNYADWSDEWVLLGKIEVAYEDQLQISDMVCIEPKLKAKREILLAKAQLVNERIANMQCIEYVPQRNASEEGNQHDTGREDQTDDSTA